MANTNRLAKINEEILRELGGLIPKLKDPRIKGLVSVTRVDTTRDMRYAKVYISTLGSEADQKEVLKGLNSASGYLRREVGAAVQLRLTPQLIFELDDSIKQGVRILEVLSSLNEREAESDDTD